MASLGPTAAAAAGSASLRAVFRARRVASARALRMRSRTSPPQASSSARRRSADTLVLIWNTQCATTAPGGGGGGRGGSPADSRSWKTSWKLIGAAGGRAVIV